MNFIFRLKLLPPSLETTHKYERIKSEHREIKTKQSILQVRKNKFIIQICSDGQWLCEKVATSSSSSSIIVRPRSRITTMGGVHTAQGPRWSCVWNAVMVSALTQASGREFHSGTVLTKNECLY